MNIGRAIKMCRLAKDLTQNQLAKRAKLSVSYISLLEKGKRDPNISIIEKLSKALNVPLAVLIFIAADENELPELGKDISNKLMKLTFELINHDK